MSGLEARSTIENSVRRELFGPEENQMPSGEPIDCSTGVLHFESVEKSRGQFHDRDSGEEILTKSDPLRRYGIGVLYGGGAQGGSPSSADDDLPAIITGLTENQEDVDGPPPPPLANLHQDVLDSDDFDLTDANSFKPSAMAISFKCRAALTGAIGITVKAASYDKIVAHIPSLKRPVDWWLRKPLELVGRVNSQAIIADSNKLKTIQTVATTGSHRVVPSLQIFSRPVPGESNPSLRLVTVALVNQALGRGPASALFQVGFKVEVDGDLVIEPYPEVERPGSDAEEQSIDLLYRNKRTYAVGHGCAADWGQKGESTGWVEAVALPSYEVTSLTPNVYVTDDSGHRTAVTVSMHELSTWTAGGRTQVESVLDLYDRWIIEQEASVGGLLPRFRGAASLHVERCREALARMREGWELVSQDPIARRAFCLANQAMLFQQARSRLKLREVERGRDDILRPVGPHPQVEIKPDQGNWRPFQIAFILATLPELVQPSKENRSVVDLIFFPTGGGKTEAYLGASAVSLLARRLRNPADSGTDTLMRYTLRLLTAQQFLRAASLICVLEDIRSENTHDLGQEPFGIGIWLGSNSTPNTWQQAKESLAKLRRYASAENMFLLLRCPWCGTQMGTKRRDRDGQDVIGYEAVGQKVVLRCIDAQCRYGGRRNLPVHVVDQDIYEVKPSIVIGTVDKFAMMAWRPDARYLFGLGDDGERETSPPSLIIQDELHLISGPLGSMVGLYESVINDLCTDRRNEVPVVPKIIASTATVRRYEDQVHGLFGRPRVSLFPPHGLEEGHSFFAEPATLPDGSPEPGRKYIGILSASLGSTQTVQVRVASATLQGAMDVPEEDRDGYWTNINFLNSLRELGNTVSLLESDVPDYLTGLRRRDDIENPRWPRTVMELTSRRRSDEIPRAIEQLQLQYGQKGCVDICLASNIIEVGIDIERLGLMTIVGQPKTTAQYIQVSGRVGRKADVSPGLVLTIYGAARPRDRSHYERFRTYHQSLYSQVEPTSVTPFAAPVIERALHAAVVAHIRQRRPSVNPHPFPRDDYDSAIAVIRERAQAVDPQELNVLDLWAKARANQWNKWERTVWDANALGGSPAQGLMRYAGTLPELDSKRTIWDVPTSMRNVDAECRVEVTLAYAEEDSREDDRQ